MDDADLRAMGDGAWRVALPTGVDRRGALDALRAVAGVTDAVVAQAHAMVRFDPSSPPAIDAVCAALRATVTSAPREHVVRVRYDGEDLHVVAHAVARTAEEVVSLHRDARYVVEVVGFLPGFAYLHGLPEALAMPRRASPRARVPAHAVGIAGRRTGIYPVSSPGGWHLLGTALDGPFFDVVRGARFAVGDVVRFEAG
jgi:UPF0271 protein